MSDFKGNFYQHVKWLKAAEAYRKTRNHSCEICGEYAAQVHHKEPLTADNITDESIAYGFDNFLLVCDVCHKKVEHGTLPTVEGVKFDADGNLIKIGEVINGYSNKI